MIWVALAALEIPIWLIVVALVTVFKNRKSVKSDPTDRDRYSSITTGTITGLREVSARITLPAA